MEHEFERTPLQHVDEATLRSLVAAISQRDETALGQLYDLTISRMYRLSIIMTGRAEDAEEIVGDVYWQIWQRSHQYDSRRGSVLTWLTIQCRSLALDKLRQRKALQAKHEQLAQQPVINAEVAVEYFLTLLQEGTEVRRALKSLPDVQQQLIALAFFNDLSHAEIAAATQLPLGTVKSHIRRGLQKLRTALESLR